MAYLLPLFPPYFRSATTGDTYVGVPMIVDAAEYPLITIHAGAPEAVDQTEGDTYVGVPMSVTATAPPSESASVNVDISEYVTRGDMGVVWGVGAGKLFILESSQSTFLTLQNPWSGPDLEDERFQVVPAADLLAVARWRELRALAENGPGARWNVRATTLEVVSGVLDLDEADGDWVPVNSTDELITSLGVVETGAHFFLEFLGAATISPLDDLGVAAGDQVHVVSLGGGNWELISHMEGL